MTLESIVQKFTQYASWLYYRQWQQWEIVGIIAAGLVVVLLAHAARRRLRAAEKRLREHSPIVGIRLAGHRRH